MAKGPDTFADEYTDEKIGKSTFGACLCNMRVYRN